MFDPETYRGNSLRNFVLLCLIVTTVSACNNVRGGEKAISKPSQPAQAVEEPKQHDATSKLLGKWVVIGDTAGQGHTGYLILNADGTFTVEYVTKNSKDTASGTFTVSDEKVTGENLVLLKLTMLQYNGKPAPAPGPLQLFYDPESNIMHDFLSVAYARPGEKVKAKKYFERK